MQKYGDIDIDDIIIMLDATKQEPKRGFKNIWTPW